MRAYEILRDKEMPRSEAAYARTARIAGIAVDILRRLGYSVEREADSPRFTTDRPISSRHMNAVHQLVSYPYKVSESNPQH